MFFSPVSVNYCVRELCGAIYQGAGVGVLFFWSYQGKLGAYADICDIDNLIKFITSCLKDIVGKKPQ